MLEISVCVGSSCHLKGSYKIVQTFNALIENNCFKDKITFKASFCMKQCSSKGVAVMINGEHFNVEPDFAEEFFNEKIVPLI